MAKVRICRRGCKDSEGNDVPYRGPDCSHGTGKKLREATSSAGPIPSSSPIPRVFDPDPFGGGVDLNQLLGSRHIATTTHIPSASTTPPSMWDFSHMSPSFPTMSTPDFGLFQIPPNNAQWLDLGTQDGTTFNNWLSTAVQGVTGDQPALSPNSSFGFDMDLLAQNSPPALSPPTSASTTSAPPSPPQAPLNDFTGSAGASPTVSLTADTTMRESLSALNIDVSLEGEAEGSLAGGLNFESAMDLLHHIGSSSGSTLDVEVITNALASTEEPQLSGGGVSSPRTGTGTLPPSIPAQGISVLPNSSGSDGSRNQNFSNTDASGPIVGTRSNQQMPEQLASESRLDSSRPRKRARTTTSDSDFEDDGENIDNDTLYVVDDQQRSKRHSERVKRVQASIGKLDSISRPYIFLYIARPESVLARNGKAKLYLSNLMKCALGIKDDTESDQNGSSLPTTLHDIVKSHAKGQVLAYEDVIAINQKVHEMTEAKKQLERQLAIKENEARLKFSAMEKERDTLHTQLNLLQHQSLISSTLS